MENLYLPKYTTEGCRISSFQLHPSKRAFRPSNFTHFRGLQTFQALLSKLNDVLALGLGNDLINPRSDISCLAANIPPIYPETRFLSANYPITPFKLQHLVCWNFLHSD